MRCQGAVEIAIRLFADTQRPKKPMEEMQCWEFVKVCAAAAGILLIAGTAHAADVFTITSSAFKDGGRLPTKKAGNNKANPNCVGENVSPPLAWTNPPAGTKSYALLMFDPEGRAPAGVEPLGRLRHSGVGHRLRRRRDVSKQSDKYVGGKGTVNLPHYFGPCTPPGPPHHYTFMLIATDLEPGALPPGLTREELLEGARRPRQRLDRHHRPVRQAVNGQRGASA